MPVRDVFICHASPDKEAYARPLTSSLSQVGVSVWLDEAVLEAGDSIADAISDGLRLTSYVLVIVTPELLRRPWPRRLLNAALSREIRLGKVVIIPVLAVEPEVWAEAFPLLADKLYLSWNDGLGHIADQVARLFHRTPAAEWVFEHPTDYVGPVWLRCTTTSDVQHIITIRWGPLIKTVSWMPPLGASWSFVHHKSNTDRVPIHINVDPPAVVTAGHGPAPDVAPYAINIDKEWARAADSPI